MREVDRISHGVEPDGAAEVIRLATTVDKALERVDLCRRDGLEH